MPLVFGDRVKETSTSVGLSSFSLDGASPGFQTFAAGIGNGNQCFFTIENDADLTWEVGIGTVSGASLSRDSVLSSSNGGLPVNFAAGTKQVFATEAAQHFNNTLDTAGHNVLNHTGIPGVPAAEVFTSPVHATTNHAGLPGVPAAETFNAVAHQAESHLGLPWSLLNEAAHDLLDHSGLTGVGGSEAYDQAAHDADDHTGTTLIAPPSQPEAEAGVATTARLWNALRVAQAIAAQTGLQVAAQFFTAVGTISIATGFQPKLALFFGRYGTTPGFEAGTLMAGYALGTAFGSQGCAGAGLGRGAQGAIAVDTDADLSVDQQHDCTTFNATQVEATQTTGANPWTGIVIVLGG